ncbi:hypothetical protein ONZ45_g18794 [Pleurotus djamor]|nr:hypothetical protein ONZ45_g18794 [Pleurotus djamor]
MEPTREGFDIERNPVDDDPRTWSETRKNIILVIVSTAAMMAGFSTNIQNPAIQQMEEDLPATSSQISLSLSLFILSQGLMPLVWSALVYLLSVGLATIACVVTAVSPNIGLVIGFRVIQGAGTSSAISIGAATLADLFPSSVRGRKMGIYYTAPALGPSLAPLLGGVLTDAFSWRACFWFLVIGSGLNFCSFVWPFKDTWRKERSLTYQNAVRAKFWVREREREVEKKGKIASHADGNGHEHERLKDSSSSPAFPSDAKDVAILHTPPLAVQPSESTVKLTLRDVSPLGPLFLVLRRINNLLILTASGSLFGFGILVSYTCARTLGNDYDYSALKIGLVLLAFGVGSLVGSLTGGRYSDYTFKKIKKADPTGSRTSPEMRLRSTLIAMLLLPPNLIGYGWASRFHVHIAVLCVLLFLNGFLSIMIYASVLAYLVDANNGRSSTAFAANSVFRGVCAFAATEIAVPLQDSLGDGWMYTIWGCQLPVVWLPFFPDFFLFFLRLSARLPKSILKAYMAASTRRRQRETNGSAKEEVDPGVTLAQAAPAMLDIYAIVSLVLGGCCANVLAYEQLLKINPQMDCFSLSGIACIDASRVLRFEETLYDITGHVGGTRLIRSRSGDVIPAIEFLISGNA